MMKRWKHAYILGSKGSELNQKGEEEHKNAIAVVLKNVKRAKLNFSADGAKLSKKFTCKPCWGDVFAKEFFEIVLAISAYGGDIVYGTQHQHHYSFYFDRGWHEDNIPVYKVGKNLVNGLRRTEVHREILTDNLGETSPEMGVFMFDEPLEFETDNGKEVAHYATFYKYRSSTGNWKLSVEIVFTLLLLNAYRSFPNLARDTGTHVYTADSWSEDRKKLQSEYLALVEKLYITLALDPTVLITSPSGQKMGIMDTDKEYSRVRGMHWRRGHIRNVWCGKRGNQHQEPRWIKPTLVGGEADG